MSLIISGTTATGVTLVAGNSPVTITASAYLNNNVSGVYALIGNTGSALNIANAGQIVGKSDGVEGVDLVALANKATGMIVGGLYGVFVPSKAGIVTNAGYIAGNGGSGIFLNSTGIVFGHAVVVNLATGTIGGAFNGIILNGTSVGTSTVTNAGVVTGTYEYGVYLQAGGLVTNQGGGKIGGGTGGALFKLGGTVVNQSSAMIGGGTDGVFIQNHAGTVTNAGAISGGGSYGVYLGAGGSVVNSSTGTIEGRKSGVVVMVGSAVATVTNAGYISGTSGYGLRLTAGGTVTNTSTGTISGGFAGISMQGASETVINAGMISGALAVSLNAGGTNRLIEDPSGLLSGGIDGGNTVGATAVSTLELAAGTTQGQLSGFGQPVANFVVNFAQVVVDPAAQWMLQGPNTLPAGTALTNSGELTVFNGGLSDAGSVVNNGQIQDKANLTVASLTSTGQVLIGANSALTTSGDVAVSQTIVFTGAGGLLDLAPSGFSGIIQGFASGDAIELAGVSNATSVGIVNGNTLAVTLSAGGPIDLVLEPDQVYANMHFDILAPGGSFGTNDFIALDAPCFAAGTRILTARGEVTVEALRVGDKVQVLLGDGLAPVIWVGRRKVDCARHPTPRKVWPVRVAAGAFGEGRPHTELWLSPDHAVYVGEVLIPVKYLVNGSTIAQVEVREVTYYHVELPAHDVLLTEGLPTESYLDTGDRAAFTNGGGPSQLFPDFSAPPWRDAPFVREARACALLIVTGPELEAARMLVNSCAAATVHADAVARHAA